MLGTSRRDAEQIGACRDHARRWGMDPPVRNATSFPFLVVRLLPSLGIVLAAIGVSLVCAGLRDGISPMVAADWPRPSTQAGASMAIPIVPPLRPRDEGPWRWVEQGRRLRKVDPDVRGRPGQAAGCLWTECARLLSAELPQMATPRRGEPWATICPCPAMEIACPQTLLATSEDRIASALFGTGQPAAPDTVGMTTTQC
jgi:hypothetical protein